MPPGITNKLFVTAVACGRFAFSCFGRVLFNPDLRWRERQQEIKGVRNQKRFAGADVIGLACDAFIEEQSVGTNHVADIGEVAENVQVAGADDGISLSQFDRGNLVREERKHKFWRLAGTRM